MKFLLIDDHVLIRKALRGILKELRRDAAVLEASTCRQAEQLVEEHGDLEVILQDLNLPDGNGFRLLGQWRQHHPEISIVVLSASSDRDNVVRALDLGAVGFIPKSAQRAVMIGALELVLSGGIYIPPEILVRGALSAEKEIAIDRLRVSPADCRLTERQVEVLALMTQGKTKGDGRVLALAEPTVKNHVAAILKALKVKNRTEAAMAVVEHGWDLGRDEK